MTTEQLFQRAPLSEAVTALRRDLLSADGPQISTMRNYRFAILPYDPEDEFLLRQKMLTLTGELKAAGWSVLSISLHQLLIDRMRVQGAEALAARISREKRLYSNNPDRALNDLREFVTGQIEGPNGIAADVCKRINDFIAANPGEIDRTLILIGRAGALFPFLRSSALLKHIDGKTQNAPVVLLYPGKRRDSTALSFMGELEPDRDYRPRIYP